MKWTVSISLLFCATTLYAGFNYDQLLKNKRDQPATVATTEPIKVAIEFGELEIPQGAVVNVKQYQTNGFLMVEYHGQKAAIAASKTDLAERVENIRSRRIVIDGVEYEDYELYNPGVTDIAIRSRSGVTRVPFRSLPESIQKQYGYDPEKAIQWKKEEAARAAAQKLHTTLLRLPLEVGMVGVSWKDQLMVLQVTGPTEMRAKVYSEEPAIIGVYDSGGYVYSPTKKSVTATEVWVTGVSTAGLVDGALINRHIIYKVSGTKSYNTVGAGVRTIFVVEPYKDPAAP